MATASMVGEGAATAAEKAVPDSESGSAWDAYARAREAALSGLREPRDREQGVHVVVACSGLGEYSGGSILIASSAQNAHSGSSGGSSSSSGSGSNIDSGSGRRNEAANGVSRRDETPSGTGEALETTPLETLADAARLHLVLRGATSRRLLFVTWLAPPGESPLQCPSRLCATLFGALHERQMRNYFAAEARVRVVGLPPSPARAQWLGALSALSTVSAVDSISTSDGVSDGDGNGDGDGDGDGADELLHGRHVQWFGPLHFEGPQQLHLSLGGLELLMPAMESKSAPLPLAAVNRLIALRTVPWAELVRWNHLLAPEAREYNALIQSCTLLPPSSCGNSCTPSRRSWFAHPRPRRTIRKTNPCFRALCETQWPRLRRPCP